MKGRKIALAISIGDKEYNYQKDGGVTFTLDELITPDKATAIWYHAMYSVAYVTEDVIRENAQDHINFIEPL